MKLFTKYNRINIITSILIFLGGCIAFYFVLDYVLVKQLDEALETEHAEIIQFAEKHNSLPEIINTNDQQVYLSLSKADSEGERLENAICRVAINKAKVDAGGTLSTNIVTNALNIGVSYSF